MPLFYRIILALSWGIVLLGLGHGEETAQSSQLPIATLKVQIEQGDKEAILELGRRGDRSVIPFLKTYLQSSENDYGSVGANAQMALAKLGEDAQFQEILHKLDSDDPWVQNDAVEKLVYVGDPRAIKALVKLIKADDNRMRTSDKAHDVLSPPLSHIAVRALARIVPNPPVGFDGNIGFLRREDIRLWEAWAKEHPELLK
jgi:hypothetical protein